MKQLIMALASAFILTLSGQSPAKSVSVKDAEYAFETCRGCHSSPGYSNVYPTYYVPKIGGQRKEYIESALLSYKNEQRPRSSMLANANGLSEKMIDAISIYIEKAAGVKHQAPHTAGNPAKGKVLAEACVACHTKDLEDKALAPILAGQYENYLVKVMKDYQSGARKDAFMQSMLTDLTEENLTDIAAYFATMEGLSIVK